MSANTPYWVPPDGMLPDVVKAWKSFFAKALSGKSGYIATPDMYLRLYVIQHGRCAICQVARGINPEDPKGRGAQRLGWDHNHATGVVRGLLCTRGEWSCNRLIGRFKDDPAPWHRGGDYLISPPARTLVVMPKDALSVMQRHA